MKVYYDISALGINPSHRQSRTGVFRVIENVAAGLLSSAECSLHFCAPNGFHVLRGALEYLDGNPRFTGVPFVMPEEVRVKKIAFKLSERIERISRSERVALPSKVIRRLSYYNLVFLEKNFLHFGEGKFQRSGIFHSPFFSLPAPSRVPATLKRFLTVCDLIPILAPHFFNHRGDHFIRHVLGSLKPDDWVTCISEATKRELCDYLSFDPSRVSVTHPAASPALFYRLDDAEALARVREKYGIPHAPYILSLSTLEPRKNIDHAIRCFARAVREGNLNDLNFVLVGPRGWDYERIFDAIADSERVKDRIIFTGFAEDQDLAALYSGALAFVYMSLYEGFGLPPLEAMQCGVPVITSNTSSLPEVVGDAGVMLDPTDADGLCQQILELYEKPSLRESLSAKSLRRAALFSWERCTRETINAYKVALES